MSKAAYDEFLQSSEKIIEFDLNRKLLKDILEDTK